MDNLEQAIDDAEKKILDIVEVAVSVEKYAVIKRHIQNTFGRQGLRGKLGLERSGKTEITKRRYVNVKPNENSGNF